MRLLSLDLERYGPFTDQRLVFRRDANLHLVFGVNEAGKSCALAAVTDLLFGIERDTRYGFLHAAKDLRIGAVIGDRDGRELAFRRRKNKPMLTDNADAVLGDDALAAFLGGVSREVFCRAFGLDAAALRRSGEELERTDGELGAALFSAASGLRGFSAAKDALEREADGIFGKTRKQARVFYQALDRYDTAKRLLRERETRAGALKALRQQLDDKERRYAEIGEQRAAMTVERARLERLARAAPVITAIDALEERLRSLGTLPAAPDAFGTQLRDAIAEATTAAAAHAAAQAAERRSKDDHDAVAVDTAILDSAEAIETLLRGSGAYQKALRDLPAVEREEAGVATALEALATRLKSADVVTLVAGQPDVASSARMAELVEDGKRVALAVDTRMAEAVREQDALAKIRRERDRRGALVDPRPLRERLAALADLRRLAANVDAETIAIAAEDAALAQAAARLTPAPRLDAIAAAPVPAAEAIQRFEARFAALDQADRSERQARDAATRDLAESTATLADLAAGGEVPTLERIAAARAERDRHWAALSAILFGAAESAAALADSVARFETAKAEADRLADAALLDAKRVASHADATRRLAAQQALAAGIDARIAATAADREVAQRDWIAAWAAAGVVPLAPADMAKWSLQLGTLLERRARLDERRLKADHAGRQIAAAEPALASLTADLGLPAMPGLPVEAVAGRIEAEITRIAEAWDAARESDALLADLEARTAAADAALRQARQAAADWQVAFAAALPRIGLADTATIAEADAVLAAWKDVPALASQSDNLKRRITGMKRDAAAFRDTVRAVAAAVAPDLVDTEPQAAVHMLNERLLQARDARTRRREAARRWQDARAATAGADDARLAAERAVATLADKIGVAVDADLDVIAGKLVERDDILAALRRRRDELANAADGRDEAVLRDALSTYDPETAEIARGRLVEEERALEREAQEVFADGKETRSRLAQLEGAVDAEVALQQRRGAEAELAEAARSWAVASIAAAMIGTAITRRRQGRQERLMVRAGELFSILTGAAYAGLGQVFDDDEVPHLVGRRRGGDEVAVADMSEGTRDQLYLALRLAYVEEFAGRVEPPPFLGDDLFTSFDEKRTAHGLAALAAVGGVVQPILFTHHRFVVETARRELGDAVDVLELG